MPANFTTLPHFSVSSAINLPNSADDPPNGVPPRSARRAFSFGSASAALTSLLSLSMTSAGVLRGARCHERACLVARDGIGDGRQIGERIETGRACHREAAHVPGPDVLDR